jgi:hypothetical protein
VLEVRDKETFIIATDEIYRGLSLGEGQMHSLAPATLGVFMASLLMVAGWLVLLMRLSVLLWLFSCKRFLHGALKKRRLFHYY